jgi:hypothetical protein
MWIPIGGIYLLLVRYFLQRKLDRSAAYMPICPRNQTDTLVWLGTNNGQFSVKSDYHLAKEISIMGRGMCSNYINLGGLWNQIWNI